MPRNFAVHPERFAPATRVTRLANGGTRLGNGTRFGQLGGGASRLGRNNDIELVDLSRRELTSVQSQDEDQAPGSAAGLTRLSRPVRDDDSDDDGGHHARRGSGGGGSFNGDSDDDDDDDDDDEDVGFAQAAPDVLREDVEAIILDLKDVIMRHKRENKKIHKLVEEEQNQKKAMERKYKELTRQYENLVAMQQFQHTGSLQSSAMKGTSVQSGGENSAIFHSAMSITEGQMQLTIDDDDAGSCRKLWRRVVAWIIRSIPLQTQFKLVQARYGDSVGSYFSFLRWIVLVNMLLGFIALIFLGVHIDHLAGLATVNDAAELNYTNPASLAALGEELTSFTWRSEFFYHLQGVSPRVLLLSSYDPGEPGEGTSVDYGERLHYTSFLLTMAVLFWTTVAIKFIQENRKAILKNPGGKNARKNTLKHSRFVLTAWDFSIPTEQEIENRKYSLGEGLFGLAFEDVVEALQRTRSMKTIVIRRLKQTAGFLVFFAALAGSVSCIVYASTQVGNGAVDEFVESSTVLAPFASLGLSSLVVPVTVAVFNAAIPKVVQFSSNLLEQWDDPGVALRMELWRMYACKVLNSFIAIFGKMLLADPYYVLTFFLEYPIFHDFIATMRAAIATVLPFDDASTMQSNASMELIDPTNLYATSGVDWVEYRNRIPPCRLDHCGQELLLLLLSEWTIGKVLKLGVALFVRILKGRKYRRLVFMVPVEMVSTLYFQLLTLVAFPFTPFLATIFGALLWVLNFEFYYLLINKFYRKPDKPWNSQNAGYSFTITYILTAGLAMLAWVFVLKATTLPKDCSRLQLDTEDARNTSLAYNVSIFAQRLPEERCLWDYADLALNELAETGSNVSTWCGSTDYAALNFDAVFEDMQLAAGLTPVPVDESSLREFVVGDSLADIDTDVLSVCMFSCGPYQYSRNGFASFSEYCTGTGATAAAAWVYGLVFESIELIYIVATLLIVVTIAKTHQLDSLRFWAKKSNDAIIKENSRLRETLVGLSDQYNMLRRRAQEKDD